MIKLWYRNTYINIDIDTGIDTDIEIPKFSTQKNFYSNSESKMENFKWENLYSKFFEPKFLNGKIWYKIFDINFWY